MALYGYGDCPNPIDEIHADMIATLQTIAREKFMPKGVFDAEGFYKALDDIRESRDLTWKQVAEKSDVSASTLTRMAQGRRPDVDSMAALLKWSGLSADNFIVDADDSVAEPPSPLATISAQFRRDKKLSPEGTKAIEATLKAMYQHFCHLENS